MPFNKRYARTLLLLSGFLLMGSDGYWCSLFSPRNDDSFGGNTDSRIRVADEQKISASSGNFNGNLDAGDRFGSAIADAGDLEADGVRDLAVGAPFDDDAGDDKGAVWMLFMDDNGRVDLDQKISANAGSFAGDLDAGDQFGSAVAQIGDLNGDGAFDLAVGAPGNDDGGADRGGVWILFLDAEGRVRQQQRIADAAGGFDGDLDDDDRFGGALAAIGDVNGDGIEDLAVGAPNDDDGRANAGAVWILFMRTDGRVASRQKISRNAGSFDGSLNTDDHFGAAIAGIGDLDRDGVPDLAVGAPGGDENGTDRGEIWVLFLGADGRVRRHQRIADAAGGFDGDLDNDDRFGSAVARIGDLNSDGVTDLAVGAPNDDDGATDAGAVWILMLNTDGRVVAWQKISERAGGFDGNLDADDHFGASVAGIGNLDNSGLADLAVGAPNDDSGSADAGAVWVLFMERSR